MTPLYDLSRDIFVQHLLPYCRSAFPELAQTCHKLKTFIRIAKYSKMALKYEGDKQSVNILMDVWEIVPTIVYHKVPLGFCVFPDESRQQPLIMYLETCEGTVDIPPLSCLTELHVDTTVLAPLDVKKFPCLNNIYTANDKINLVNDDTEKFEEWHTDYRVIYTRLPPKTYWYNQLTIPPITDLPNIRSHKKYERA
jgi:hypothetical protein